MKRLLVILMASFMLLQGCGLDSDGNNKDKSEDKKSAKELSGKELEAWKRDVALENIDGVLEIISDENYVILMVNDNEVLDIFEEWSDSEIDQDSDVLVIYMDEDILADYLEVDGDDISDAAKKNIRSGLGRGLASATVSRFGIAYLSATSIGTYGTSYVAPAKMDDQLWIINSDKDGLAYMLSFINSGDGVISVSASLLPYDGEKDFEDIIDMFPLELEVDTKEIEWETEE